VTDDEIKALFVQAKKHSDDRAWVLIGVVCVVAPVTWAVIWGVLYAILQRVLM
jgi:hypothetical protein